MDTFPAGIVHNEAAQLARARLRTEPPSKDVHKPTFPLGIDRRPDYPEHYGWNPVYWSDYPKQPMWTVPLPKIAAPIVSRILPDLPELPCHRPPTEYTTPNIYPRWIPDIPKWTPTFNPYADEHNLPFKHLVGPPTLPPVVWIEKLRCQ
ncbi:unnamed protein product [Candidula unifasciata]|uniref:Uncharacterized protein n=1 Tax=Candidula unifasciata TaxID=100452 RepID=A0A8S3ZAJ2_9EUPU|nr:unnamed protein product [Candidula unifasciata]